MLDLISWNSDPICSSCVIFKRYTETYRFAPIFSFA